MKKFIFVAVLMFFCMTAACAYGVGGVVGARALAIGNIGVTYSDQWSVLNNPAGMASLHNWSIGAYYENRFLLKETALKNANLNIPLNIGTFGVSVQQYGYEKYNENRFTIAFARAFGPYLRIGLSLDYLLFCFSDGYDRLSAATVGIGAQSDLSEKIHLGAYIFNPTASKTKTLTKSKIPIIMRFGISYDICEEVVASAEIEDETDIGLRIKTGIEYKAFGDFFIRAGFASNPGKVCFGAGYSVGRLTIDISSQIHQKLGPTLQCGLIFKIKKQKEAE